MARMGKSLVTLIIILFHQGRCLESYNTSTRNYGHGGTVSSIAETLPGFGSVASDMTGVDTAEWALSDGTSTDSRGIITNPTTGQGTVNKTYTIYTDTDRSPMYTTGDGRVFEEWSWHPIPATWYTIFQASACIVGILGNFLVMLVTFRSGDTGKSTDTLVGALAVADWLTSIFLIPIPQVRTLPTTWLGQLYCKIIETKRPMWIAILSSVFTLTAISIERFVAVVFPFRFKHMFTPKKTSLLVVAIWFLSVIINTNIIVAAVHVHPEINVCIRGFPSHESAIIYGIIAYLSYFLCPTVIMLTTQAYTAHQLQCQVKLFEDGLKCQRSDPRYHLVKARQNVIKLLFVVIVVFVVSWGPGQNVFLSFSFGLISPEFLDSRLDRILTSISFINSCVNPIIYTLRFPKFRQSLKSIFKSSGRRERSPIFDEAVQTA